jgi:hypothetical protein
MTSVDHATLRTIPLPGMALRSFGMSPVGELSESTRLEHGPPRLLDVGVPAIHGWLR